ncbi:MAG: amino acid decarboxylase [Ruminococcaceae bacterium]|nr:amino acid decarboxylase [Oscillospiraceae bacterium]MBR3597598.1 PLP-dependent transferase [Clostridia bacterium]
MMNTPVYDFIKEYAEKNTVRLHVPGHKGKAGEFCEAFDITEIDGADVLYHETGILAESQKNASAIFGTAKTVYSTEGSSLCIRAMLTLIKMLAVKNGRKPVIAAGRNAHKVFMIASALLDIEVQWIFPENKNSVISADISTGYLESFLDKKSELPTAVYITSPDYLGNLSDIKGLAEVCHKRGVFLAVDNAHGAYLNFLHKNRHPIFLGADICCDSAHKTLPVLTGGAYLHISETAPSEFRENAENAMSIFASTSPSYLILASLDKVNEYLEYGFVQGLSALIERLDTLKKNLISRGYSLIGNEPLKITVATKCYGYKGFELAEILRNNGIECEFYDPDYTVMMFTVNNSEDEISQVEKVLLSLEKKEEISCIFPKNPILSRKLSIKEALFSPSEEIKTEDAVGRILASPSVTCPPAVPIAISGEELNEEAVKCFSYYGIEKINVIKEV